MTDIITDTAKIVHEAMVHAVREFKGKPQPWQNGNSVAEAYARRAARDILALTPSASVPAEPLFPEGHHPDDDNNWRRRSASVPAELVERNWKGAAKVFATEVYGRSDCPTITEDIAAVKAIFAAIPPAGRAEEWQPIETAPKDGTQILLSADDWVVQGRYHNDACRWFELNADPTDAWDGEIYQPTHWRPLPDPPALSGETGTPPVKSV